MGQGKQTTMEPLRNRRTQIYNINHLEGGHDCFKYMIQHTHPNIYTHFNYRNEEQVANEITMNQYQPGGVGPAKRQKYMLINSHSNSTE